MIWAEDMPPTPEGRRALLVEETARLNAINDDLSDCQRRRERMQPLPTGPYYMPDPVRDRLSRFIGSLEFARLQVEDNIRDLKEAGV